MSNLVLFSKADLVSPQSDDSNALNLQLSQRGEQHEDQFVCPEDFARSCEHGCKMVNNKPTCECLPGYTYRSGSCEDIDECQKENGNCEQGCENTPGSYHCTCPEGFKVTDNGVSCEDVNECSTRNGHGPCQDVCENTKGSYKCSCTNLIGTRLSNDQHTCENVDDCMTSGCSHGCVSTRGKAFCTCPDGMILGSDWKTCRGN